MAGVKAAVFSVTVDNQQDIEAWLAAFQRAHQEAKGAFDALCAVARDTPLIQLTIHRDEA